MLVPFRRSKEEGAFMRTRTFGAHIRLLPFATSFNSMHHCCDLPNQELARMCEGIKGEVEGLRTEASQIRTQQAPWEAQAAEVNGRVSVATAERDLLLKKQGDAQKRLKASILSVLQPKIIGG